MLKKPSFSLLERLSIQIIEKIQLYDNSLHSQ